MNRHPTVATSLALAIALTALACSPVGRLGPRRLRGYTAESSRAQVEYERELRERIDPSRIEAHLEQLASGPHPPGTPEAARVAEYVRDRLAEYGWSAEIEEYTAWLPLPIEVELTLLDPSPVPLQTTESPVPGDPWANEQAVARFPGWNGYSASGEVVAPIVYAHHGSDADFRTLIDSGVDPAGKIVLLRYFEVGEGRKVFNAQKYGAAGVILYADPEEDGFAHGAVYPEGNWRPEGSIMRRSVEYEPYTGDPLSPGFASVPGAPRLAPEDTDLPRIPVVPTSYASVRTLMGTIGGPEAPEAWQGALAVRYRLGGEARVRMVARMDNADRPMRNVMARLEGARFPDEWILFGNHHDAWIYGAGDPSSGTAALLEWARVVGELADEGHPPARTLVIGVWDAEEMLLGGSTEYVEHHRQELLEHAVAKINMDSAVFNTERPLRVAAHASLHDLFREVSATLTDPRTGEPFDRRWAAMQRESFPLGSVDGFGYFWEGQSITEPWIFEYPSDDAAPFMNYLALPASDMYYGGDYGMYHSIYENLHWMRTVVDPGFEYHSLMARLQAVAGLRLANADLLPLEFATEAVFWRQAWDDLTDDFGDRVPLAAEAQALIDAWEGEARGLAADLSRTLSLGDLDEAELRAVNRVLYRLPRDFYRPEGTPGRPWNQNLFAGSAHDLENPTGSLLPGIRFALAEGDAEVAAGEAARTVGALRARLDRIRQLRQRLGR